MKFTPIKKRKIIVEKKGNFERSVSIELNELGKLEITQMSELVNIEPQSWGTGWGSNFSPEEFLALKELIKNIEVVEDNTHGQNT